MKIAVNQPKIDREEWDFKNKYQEVELELCYIYEYGRTSDVTKQIWKRGILIRKKDGVEHRFGRGKHPVIFEEPLPDFIEKLLSPNTLSVIGFASEFPNQPWTTISKDKREKLVNGVKNSGEKISKALHDLFVSNPVKKEPWLVKLGQFLDMPFSLPPDGKDIWVMAIDWRKKDSVLIEMFKEWLQSNPRPKHLPAKKDSGRKSFFQDSLNALGALRLLRSSHNNSERAVQEIQSYVSEVEPLYKAVYSDERSLRKAAAKAEKILEENFGQIKSK